MKLIMLGSGTSTGVPRIGGEDGAGDWGECDPDEPRNRRSRVSIIVETGSTRSMRYSGRMITPITVMESMICGFFDMGVLVQFPVMLQQRLCGVCASVSDMSLLGRKAIRRLPLSTRSTDFG